MLDSKEQEKVGFFKKWYIYQKERFPVLVFLFYTLCIVVGVFIIANFCNGNGNTYFDSHDFYIKDGKFTEVVSSKTPEEILNNKFDKNTLKIDKYTVSTFLAMWFVCFLQFLMVRIIDEFKDYEEDCKFRSYRPVPRGLITLGELKVLFAICFVLQVIITYIFKGSFIAFALLWIMFLFMTKGFFIKKILDKHIVLELLLDELMLPVLAIYLMSFVFDESLLFYLIIANEDKIHTFFNYKNDSSMNSGTIMTLIEKIRVFLVMSYFCSCIAEIARKIRSKDKEEKGVNTYTAVLGIEKAVLLLSVIELCVLVCQYIILNKTELITLFAIFTVCIVINIVFIFKSEHKFSKLVELSGNLYLAFAYLSMCILYGNYLIQ